MWTQFIGALVKNGQQLGVERLQLVMRHLTLRRTKESLDKHGKPILSLPPVSHKIIRLQLDPVEKAFYSSHYQSYKHAFEQLEQTDSVLKNFCSILQEILRLRQICVHMALVKDAEDVGGAGDLIETINKHGISKPRAIALLSMSKDAGMAQCAECGTELLAGVAGANEADEDLKPDATNGRRKPAKRARKATTTSTGTTATGSASASAVNSEDDAHSHFNAAASAAATDSRSIVTRCQHLFCRPCFLQHVYADWGDGTISATARAACSVCRQDLTPALDAVEVGVDEFERAIVEENVVKEEAGAGMDSEAEEGRPRRGGARAKAAGVVVKKEKKPKPTRFFEHSTKMRWVSSVVLSGRAPR